MDDFNKGMLKSSLRNGIIFTSILVLITYFKNGLINYKYIPLWFIFFAGTGALRYYYQNKKRKD